MSPAEHETISMVIGEHILRDREGEGYKLLDDVTLACYMVTLFETVVTATTQDLSCNQSGAEIWCPPLLILDSQVDSGGPVHAGPFFERQELLHLRDLQGAYEWQASGASQDLRPDYVFSPMATGGEID
jgi:hypothetical protein